MNKNIFIIIALCAMCLSCAKKDRLTTSTIDIAIEPGSQVLNLGVQQQFTATGISQKTGTVTITPLWNVVPSTLGTFNVSQGETVIFTAQSSGLGVIHAAWSEVIGEAEIAVKDASGLIVDDQFGIYSETDRLKLTIDTDSSIGVSFSTNAEFLADSFKDITTSAQEGSYAKKTTVLVPSTNAWAGWYIQYGLMLSNDTINMDYYKNGYLKFWIRSPIDLEIKIRSSNLDPDNNPAKIILGAGHGFQPDDEWYDVSIKLSDFPGALNWTAMKDLFIISSVSALGGTGGASKTFYVDHIRWTKQ